MMETDLGYFLAVLETGSYGRAAERLGVTQPAVSKGIQRIERRLAIRLFERGPRGVRPTAAGVHFAEHARLILRNLDLAAIEMSRMRGRVEGVLRVGISPFMAERFVPLAIGKLLARHPDLALRVLTDVNIRLIDALRRGELDMVFSGVLPRDMMSGLRCRVLAADRLGLLVRHGHPLLSAEPARPSDLKDRSWVLHGREVLSRRWLDTRLDAHGLNPIGVSLESNSITHLLAVVEVSDCVTFLPWAAIPPEKHGRTLDRLPIPDFTWSHEIGVVHRADLLLPAAWRQLVELVRQSVAGLADPESLQASDDPPAESPHRP